MSNKLRDMLFRILEIKTRGLTIHANDKFSVILVIRENRGLYTLFAKFKWRMLSGVVMILTWKSSVVTRIDRYMYLYEVLRSCVFLTEVVDASS